MTREQQILLARLECATDRFVLAARLSRRSETGVVGVAQRYLNMRKVTIYAGSNEIQRNIMAKLILGM